MSEQLQLTLVPATGLRIGDRIEVRFAVYGAVMCPIVADPSERTMNNGKTILDIGVRIGENGPCYCTVENPDSLHTVLR